MIFTKELQEYTIDELKYNFNIDTYTIKVLFEKKILYKTKKSTFYFKFVGIMIINDEVIFSLPKYIQIYDKIQTARQILILLREYSRRENLNIDELETISSVESMTDYNLFSTLLFLLMDYFENGIYSNEKCIYALNSENEIDWLKTINEIQPVISSGELIYLDYYTSLTQNDEENYFRQLHRYILVLCYDKLDKFGLSEILNIEPIEFEIDEYRLGTYQMMVSKLKNELDTQFVTRKQLVLKAMLAFISNERIDLNNSNISFYGTRTFYMVWEKACGYVLNNSYEDVKKYIAPPAWKTLNNKIYETDTLIPDIISIDNHRFIIADAKYYNIVLTDDKKLTGNPGIQDISKQYLYQLAFDNYIKTYKFTVIKNLLLFPTEQENMILIGDVTIPFLKKLNLEDIMLYKLPAKKIFELYIASKKIDLDLFLNCKL